MEKNCQKRRQPLISDSVIARLMGIDELHHQQPLHKYQRVLSDGYISKSASVGLRHGSSIFIGRSRDTNNEMLQRVKGACGVKVFEDKNHFVADKYTRKNTRTVKTVIPNEKPVVVSLSYSTYGARHEDRKALVTNGKHGAPGNVLRYPEKLDNSSTDQYHGLATGYINDFSTIQSDVIDKSYVSPCVSTFSPKLEKTTNYCGVTKLDLLSRSEIRDSLRPESGSDCDLAYKELFGNDIEPLVRSFIDRNRTKNRTSRQQIYQRNLQVLSRPASEDENYLRNESQASFPSCPGVYYYRNYNYSPRVLLYKSSLGQETLKKNYERRKTKKEIEKIEVSGRGQTHVMEALCTQSCKQSRNFGSTPLDISRIKVWEKDHSGNLLHSESETNKESLSVGSGGKMDEGQEILKNRNVNGCDQLSSPIMSSSMLQSATSVEISSCCSSRKCSESNSPDAYAETIRNDMEGSSENDWCREIKHTPSVSRPSNLTFQCRVNDALVDAEAFDGGVFLKISGDQQPESNSDFFSLKDASSSYCQEASSGETSFYEFSEESCSSNCSRLVPPKFQKQLDGPIGQCSPDSVLESFDTKYPSTFECFEGTGQQSQFQVFNSESEEAYSEGSEMVVSGNEEEKEEGIADLSYNSGKVHRWLGDDESRNFCYIVDVLDEAGCFKERPIIDIIKSWDCLGCPISPLVFEALEKKYGRQVCWQRSDRQLLFDLINSGLTTILERLLNFNSRATSSLQRHFTAGMKRDEVEDMLWKMVISLEGEKSKDESEKVVEGAMKWWEVDDKDTNVISGELELLLFEELVMESLSLWIE